MTREEGIHGYARINKAYNEIFDALQDLMEQGFDDDKFISCANYSLRVLDEGLDYYKEKYVSAPADSKEEETSGFKVMKGSGSSGDSKKESDESKDKKLFAGFKVLGGKKK